MPLQRAVLTVTADADSDGQVEEGKFTMVGDLEISPGIRTGYVVGGRGSTANSVIAGSVFDGESKRKGIHLEFGGGEHVVEVEFRGWKGAIDSDGNDVQWGDTGNPNTTTETDATGADPVTQIDVLLNYLLIAEIDSRNPAQLEYGEFSEDGLFDPLDVVIEGPQFTRSAKDGSWFDGSMTFVSTQSLDDVRDAAERRLR